MYLAINALRAGSMTHSTSPLFCSLICSDIAQAFEISRTYQGHETNVFRLELMAAMRLEYQDAGTPYSTKVLAHRVDLDLRPP